MKIEDKRLHQPPEPWCSKQRWKNYHGLLFSSLFIGAGIVFLFLSRLISTQSTVELIAWAVVFLIIGIFFSVLSIYENIDGKSEWILILPFSITLYEKIEEPIEKLLKDTYQQYYKKDKLKFHPILDKTIEKEYDCAYTLDFNQKPSLDLEYSMNVYYTRPTSREFPITINNIRVENLQDAHRLANNITKLLDSIDYKNYPSQVSNIYKSRKYTNI